MPAPPGDSTEDGGEIVDKGIEIHVNSFAGGGLHQDVMVTNRTLAPAILTIDWEFAADFADLDEVVAGKRSQTAPVTRTWRPGGEGEGELRYTYEHPRLAHATHIRFQTPGRIDDDGTAVRLVLVLEPQRPALIAIDIALIFLGETVEPWFALDGEPTNHHPAPYLGEQWQRDTAHLSTDNPVVQAAWTRAVEDLGAMQRLLGEGVARMVPMAGIPKYTALFGRDSLVAGLQSMLLTPTTMEASLRAVGEWTARVVDDAYDAQPGKVLHQHQRSPLAVLGKNPFEHYYGDYSAPAAFILGAALHFAHTGDKEAFAACRPNVFATLEWMDRDGDIDGDGFYEFRTLAGDKGIKNQGWKDSGQAILYPDGSMVPDPIAVAEIQGLYYAAKQALAGVLACLGETARADDLMRQAAALKARFNDRFWMKEERYVALGLDPQKNPIRTIASDAGSCLTYGILAPEQAIAVRDRIMAPDMFSGWGIRTLSSDHPAYNPMAYHLGTVWPVSSSNVCFGLRRHGFTEACHRLAEAIFAASDLFDYNRLPEVFGGHPRDRRHPHPGIYPDSCSPQAWSATAVVNVVHALVGVTPIAPLGTLVIDPALPAWLPRLTLRNVQVGRNRVDLAFHRDADGTTHHEVLSGAEGLTIVRPDPLLEGEDRIAHGLAGLMR